MLPLGVQQYIQSKSDTGVNPSFWKNLWSNIKNLPQEVWNTASNTAQLSFHRPFPNTYQSYFKEKTPQQLNIFFTGAAESEGDLFDETFKDYKLPYQMFRHVDYDKAKDLITELKKKYPKLKFNVFGHSMGTRAAAKLAKDFPEVKAVLFDPVYPFGRPYPKNVNKNMNTFYPSDTSPLQNNISGALGNLVALVGGRRQPEQLGTKGQYNWTMRAPSTHVNIVPTLRWILQRQKKGKGLTF